MTPKDCPFCREVEFKYCDASCKQFFGIPLLLKRYGLWPFGYSGTKK